MVKRTAKNHDDVCMYVCMYVQVEPGKKVAAFIQVADEGLRATLDEERDILALLGR